MWYISNVTVGQSSSNLSTAYIVGAVLLVLGDLSTTVFKLHLFSGLVVFTSFCFTIYMAAANLSGIN